MKSIIQQATERGEFLQDVDGYYVYCPEMGGGLSSAVLRILAQHLDDENAVWHEQVKLVGRNINPLWIEGLKLIDRMIVALHEAGFVLSGGDDGGDEWLPIFTRKQAIEMVASVDESTLRFRNAECQHHHVVWLIPGNGPDAITDHNGAPEFYKVIDSLTVDSYDAGPVSCEFPDLSERS